MGYFTQCKVRSGQNHSSWMVDVSCNIELTILFTLTIITDVHLKGIFNFNVLYYIILVGSNAILSQFNLFG